MKKIYIQPEVLCTVFATRLMEVRGSVPQGNDDDPIVDDEDDILTKGRNRGNSVWGDLW